MSRLVTLDGHVKRIIDKKMLRKEEKVRLDRLLTEFNEDIATRDGLNSGPGYDSETLNLFNSVLSFLDSLINSIDNHITEIINSKSQIIDPLDPVNGYVGIMPYTHKVISRDFEEYTNSVTTDNPITFAPYGLVDGRPAYLFDTQGATVQMDLPYTVNAGNGVTGFIPSSLVANISIKEIENVSGRIVFIYNDSGGNPINNLGVHKVGNCDLQFGETATTMLYDDVKANSDMNHVDRVFRVNLTGKGYIFTDDFLVSEVTLKEPFHVLEPYGDISSTVGKLYDVNSKEYLSSNKKFNSSKVISNESFDVTVDDIDDKFDATSMGEVLSIVGNNVPNRDKVFFIPSAVNESSILIHDMSIYEVSRSTSLSIDGETIMKLNKGKKFNILFELINNQIVINIDGKTYTRILDDNIDYDEIMTLQFPGVVERYRYLDKDVRSKVDGSGRYILSGDALQTYPTFKRPFKWRMNIGDMGFVMMRVKEFNEDVDFHNTDVELVPVSGAVGEEHLEKVPSVLPFATRSNANVQLTKNIFPNTKSYSYFDGANGYGVETNAQTHTISNGMLNVTLENKSLSLRTKAIDKYIEEISNDISGSEYYKNVVMGNREDLYIEVPFSVEGLNEADIDKLTFKLSFANNLKSVEFQTPITLYEKTLDIVHKFKDKTEEFDLFPNATEDIFGVARLPFTEDMVTEDWGGEPIIDLVIEYNGTLLNYSTLPTLKVYDIKPLYKGFKKEYFVRISGKVVIPEGVAMDTLEELKAGFIYPVISEDPATQDAFLTDLFTRNKMTDLKSKGGRFFYDFSLRDCEVFYMSSGQSSEPIMVQDLTIQTGVM